MRPPYEIIMEAGQPRVAYSADATSKLPAILRGYGVRTSLGQRLRRLLFTRHAVTALSLDPIFAEFGVKTSALLKLVAKKTGRQPSEAIFVWLAEYSSQERRVDGYFYEANGRRVAVTVFGRGEHAADALAALPDHLVTEPLLAPSGISAARVVSREISVPFSLVLLQVLEDTY